MEAAMLAASICLGAIRDCGNSPVSTVKQMPVRPKGHRPLAGADQSVNRGDVGG
jgi:hypothetical protein